jgi:hypothetical protein
MSDEESDEESEYFIIINKDGDVVLISTNENGLTQKQFKMLEKVVAISDPSFILLIILYIEVFFNRLIDKIK